jgi:peptidyl-Lys metalloendopeptidase
MERRAAQANKLAARSIGKRGITIDNCSGQTLNDAVLLSAQVASLYIADAEKYLTTVTGSSERYTTWFGEFAQTNHDTVLNHYATIRKSDVKTYTYDCACTEDGDIFAYVFPDEFGHIYLCSQYIAANVSGTDSKAGTIVHESTHFTRNAGTKDIAYGKTRCQSLAITNATAAIGNADSHEYFAENDSPSLA